RVCQIFGRYRLIGTRSDPRINGVTLAVLLKLLEEIVQAAAQYAAGSTACKQPAQSAFHQITQSATAVGDVDACVFCSWLRASIARSGRWLLRAGETFDRLVGKQTEDRHGDRRHPTAAGARIGFGVTLSMRSILHPIEDINQAHVSPPSKEKLFLTL